MPSFMLSLFSFSVKSSVGNIACTERTPRKTFLHTLIDCSCSAVGKMKESRNPERLAYCSTVTKLETPNATANGITAIDNPIKGFRS